LDDKLGGLLKSCMIQAKQEAKGVTSFSGDRSAALPILSGWNVRRSEKYGPEITRDKWTVIDEKQEVNRSTEQ